MIGLKRLDEDFTICEDIFPEPLYAIIGESIDWIIIHNFLEDLTLDKFPEQELSSAITFLDLVLFLQNKLEARSMSRITPEQTYNQASEMFRHYSTLRATTATFLFSLASGIAAWILTHISEKHMLIYFHDARTAAPVITGQTTSPPITPAH